jgi:hypothetical protein
MFAVWFFAVRMNKTNTEGILLRFENTKLLDDLKVQTLAAESARIKAKDSDRAKASFSPQPAMIYVNRFMPSICFWRPWIVPT